MDSILQLALSNLQNTVNNISRLPDSDEPSEELLARALSKVKDAQKLLEAWGSWNA